MGIEKKIIIISRNIFEENFSQWIGTVQFPRPSHFNSEKLILKLRNNKLLKTKRNPRAELIKSSVLKFELMITSSRTTATEFSVKTEKN